MYSIDNKESFDDLENWIKILIEENSFEKPIYLVGNKNDLEMEREISLKQGEEYAEKYGLMFSESSLKNDSWDKIKSIFEDLAKVVYKVSLGKDKTKIIEQPKEKKKKNEKIFQNKLTILMKYLSF